MASVTTSAPSTPTFFTAEWIAKFSTAKYDAMIATGLLLPEDNIELLENYLVLKKMEDSAHDGTALRVRKRLTRVLPTGWDIREQGTLALSDSRPEPDFAIVREDPADYTTRHPTPADTRLVIEVANTSLMRDRQDKARIYSRANIACYWIVNLDDRGIEVYTQPSGPGDSPAYASVQHFTVGSNVPLMLDGNTIATIPVTDLLP